MHAHTAKTVGIALAVGLVVLGLGAVAQAAAPANPDHVVVNEVQTHPAGEEAGNEWAELYNPTSEAVSLDGWMLTDNDVYFGLGEEPLDGITLEAQERRNITLENLRLANTGDDLDLLDADGEAVDSAHYGDEGALPTADEGQSIARSFLLDVDAEEPPETTGFLADGGDDEWYVEDRPSPGQPNKPGLPV